MPHGVGYNNSATGGPLGSVPGQTGGALGSVTAEEEAAAFGRPPPGQTGGPLGGVGGAMDYMGGAMNMPMGGALSMLGQGQTGGLLGQVPGTEPYNRRNMQAARDASATGGTFGSYGR